MWHDGWYGYHMGWWGAGLMGFLILILLVILILKQGAGSERSTSQTALDILKRRYAAGEISEAEFEHMRDELLA